MPSPSSRYPMAKFLNPRLSPHYQKAPPAAPRSSPQPSPHERWSSMRTCALSMAYGTTSEHRLPALGPAAREPPSNMANPRRSCDISAWYGLDPPFARLLLLWPADRLFQVIEMRLIEEIVPLKTTNHNAGGDPSLAGEVPHRLLREARRLDEFGVVYRGD